MKPQLDFLQNRVEELGGAVLDQYREQIDNLKKDQEYILDGVKNYFDGHMLKNSELGIGVHNNFSGEGL